MKQCASLLLKVKGKVLGETPGVNGKREKEEKGGRKEQKEEDSNSDDGEREGRKQKRTEIKLTGDDEGSCEESI